MDGIESMCSHLPGIPAKLCKDEVEKMFPVAVSFLTTIVVSSCVSICVCDWSNIFYFLSCFLETI